MMRLLFVLICILTPSIAMADESLSEFYEQLRYLSERDKVLSENIANADTPGYKPKELRKRRPADDVAMAKTNGMHMDLDGASDEFSLVKGDVSEIKPNGNSVNVERELFKKSENATRLNETVNLYNKAKGMLNTAVVGNK